MTHLMHLGGAKVLFSTRRRQASKLDFARHLHTKHQICPKVQTGILRNTGILKVFPIGWVDTHALS